MLPFLSGEWYDPAIGAYRHFISDNRPPLFGDAAHLTASDLATPIQMGEFMEGLERHLYDTIPVIISLPNFIYELKDLKGLILKWKGLVKTMADAFLALEFGVLPFLSDLKHLVTSLSDTRRALMRLRKENRRWQIYHYRKRYYEMDPDPVFETLEGVSAGGPVVYSHQQGLFRRAQTRITNIHSCVVIRRTYEGLDSKLADLNSLLVAYGFTNPAKVIWNAIPYSFILEWFVNLDGFFDSLAFHPFEGTYEVAWSHTTFTKRTLWELTLPIPNSNGDLVFVPQGTAYSKEYIRRKGLYALPDDSSFEGLSPMQLALGSALALQRVL
jgi:hypothetical protein